MKRNMGPLLGIAVVVAIISTGVFYGLFAGKLRSTPADSPGRPLVVAARNLERGAVLKADDIRVSQIKSELSGSYSKPDQVVGATLLASLKADEPVLAERVVSQDPAASSGVPSGSRALSIRVSESDGVVGLLRPGARVDLQAVQERTGGVVELRTILENVEVLAVNPKTQPGGGNRGTVSVVTVLTRAEASDAVALADSGARIRLALRNPLDDQVDSRRSLDLSAVFQSSRAIRLQPAETQAPAQPVAKQAPSIGLQVTVLRASETAAKELGAKVKGGSGTDSLAVARFSEGIDADALVRSIQQKHEAEIIASRSLTAESERSTRFQAGSGGCRLVVRFSSTPTGQLKVTPEISVRSGQGVETRQYEDQLPAGSSFLVTGILEQARDRRFLEQLFPKHSWTDQRLLILVTSQPAGVPWSASQGGTR